jgi:transcriptional regulator with XRE-family HTH domain
MNDALTQDSTERQTALPAILKAIRRRRGLRPAEVARGMGLPLRTYQRFESAAGGLDLERIHHFAEVVNADGWAVVLAADMGSVEFALRCLDNKAASVLLLALQRFNAKAGACIPRLDPRSLILAFGKAFDELEAKARSEAAYLEQWMFDPGLNAGPDDQS